MSQYEQEVETYRSKFITATDGVVNSYKSRNLDNYISRVDFKSLTDELAVKDPDFRKVQNGLAAMQNKMVDKLGKDGADKLLKDVYGSGFDYKNIIGGLKGETTSTTAELTNDIKGGIADLWESAKENPKTSLLVAACAVAGLGFGKNLLSGKAGFSGTLLAIGMLVGLWAIAENAIGMAKASDAPPRAIPVDDDREQGIPANQLAHQHQGQRNLAPSY